MNFKKPVVFDDRFHPVEGFQVDNNRLFLVFCIRDVFFWVLRSWLYQSSVYAGEYKGAVAMRFLHPLHHIPLNIS
jgi:hypothetical protein